MSDKKEKIPGLEVNVRTGLYQIIENDVTYNFAFDMMANLKAYLQNEFNEGSLKIAAWYKQLDMPHRRKVYINAGFEN